MAGRVDRDPEAQWIAARMLRGGKLVALPTETVYGLAADVGNERAVRRIFEVKGRPSTNPLIVHVADVDAARRCVSVWPAEAEALAARFWPGPLTIVLPRASTISDLVTARGPTVAVRVPDHSLTLSILREFHALGGIGVAAPSANRSEHISPTTAQHVRDDLGNRLDFILDGGPCRVGIESTVIRLGDGVPMVLRLGDVTLEQLRTVLDDVQIADEHESIVQSPGRHARHYSPSLPTFVVEEAELNTRLELPSGVAIVKRADAPAAPPDTLVREMPLDAATFGASLYATLRELESVARIIVLVLPPDESQWSAVRDRMRRAGTPLAESPGES